MGIEFYIVPVGPVPDGQGAQTDVGPGDGRLKSFSAQACLGERLFIGNNQYFLSQRPAHIHHGHLLQLFQTFGKHIFAELAQLGETAAAGQGHIQEEGGQVTGIGLEHLGAVHPGKRRHAAVYFLIHLYEEVIHIGPVVESKAEGAGAVTRLAGNVLQPSHLHELLPQRFHHALIHFAGRQGSIRRLNRDVRDVRIGDERNRQQAKGYQPQHNQGQKHHGNGYRPVYETLQHHFLRVTEEPSARLRFPLMMTRSPSESCAPRSRLGAITWLSPLE